MPIHGKIIQIFSEIWIFKENPGKLIQSFSEISFFQENLGKLIKSFSKISVFQKKSWGIHPITYRNLFLWKIEIFKKKILDEFSRNTSVSHPGKLKFRKNFWIGFPGFADKG